MQEGLVRRRGAHTCGCRRGAHARGLASCHRASMAAGESSFLLFSSYFIHSERSLIREGKRTSSPSTVTCDPPNMGSMSTEASPSSKTGYQTRTLHMQPSLPQTTKQGAMRLLGLVPPPSQAGPMRCGQARSREISV